MNTITYILTSNSKQFLTDQFNYFNTELRTAYTPKYSFNLIQTQNSILIQSNCPYIFNSDGYHTEAKKYNTTISETWKSETGEIIDSKIYY